MGELTDSQVGMDVVTGIQKQKPHYPTPHAGVKDDQPLYTPRVSLVLFYRLPAVTTLHPFTGEEMALNLFIYTPALPAETAKVKDLREIAEHQISRLKNTPLLEQWSILSITPEESFAETIEAYAPPAEKRIADLATQRNAMYEFSNYGDPKIVTYAADHQFEEGPVTAILRGTIPIDNIAFFIRCFIWACPVSTATRGLEAEGPLESLDHATPVCCEYLSIFGSVGNRPASRSTRSA